MIQVPRTVIIIYVCTGVRHCLHEKHIVTYDNKPGKTST